MRVESKFKIMSVVLAVIIWFYVMGERGRDTFVYWAAQGLQKKTFHHVPIQVLQDSGEAMAAVSVQPETMDIDVLGPRKAMRKLLEQDVLAFVKVTDFMVGSYEMIATVVLPSEVQVISELKPVHVNVHLSSSHAAAEEVRK